MFMSLSVRVIPQMLFKGHQLIKGVNFDAWRSVGVVSQAMKIYQMREVDEVMLLDITATRDGRRPDFGFISKICEQSFMPVSVGGGIKTLDDIRGLLNSGADKVVIGWMGFNYQLISSASKKFGSQCIVVSVDIDNGRLRHKFFGGGPIDKNYSIVVSACKIIQQWGAGEILLQAVNREGFMQGYDCDLINKVSNAVSIPVIASCGCGTYDHMHEAIKAGAHAVAAGSMFHFTDQTPRGAAEYLNKKGVEVRL